VLKKSLPFSFIPLNAIFLNFLKTANTWEETKQHHGEQMGRCLDVTAIPVTTRSWGNAKPGIGK
jgi:hypothetical protein